MAEPETPDSFFVLAHGGHLEPIERKSVIVVADKSAKCYIGTAFVYEIRDRRSTVRCPAGTPLDIVVRPKNQDVDPSKWVLVYPLRVTKEQRQVPVGCGLGRPLHIEANLHSRQVQVDFAKYGQTSIKMTPQTPLPPGEYAITVLSPESQNTAYCFGIDEAK